MPLTAIKSLVRLVLALVLVLPTTVSFAQAFNPVGTWRTRLDAEIRIERCGAERYCGTVSKAAKPGLTDKRNPDPKLRDRPIEGILLITFSKSDEPKTFVGELYNPLDGKMYEGTAKMPDPQTIRLKGCLFYSILCLKEDWVKIAP
ncbi:DUF2147 domain-containing protein [Maritalea mediterranea]|uniref:DUF2147 domain-containing protein n=1 Tax=Maritalea mediterranea TaxID=2909667 RepID=A0ABS9E7F6_9HYPH|nr:DUF2147 domain-containing protein [Maritalea mediterranea]MCF4098109.1 DUF2147 domain-containing protein [Maritalea mediterranea]